MEQRAKYVRVEKNGRVKIYERVQSRVHKEIYHLMKIDLQCRESTPSEIEIKENMKTSKFGTVVTR